MRALRSELGREDEDATWLAFLRDTIWQTPMPDYLLYGEPYPALNGVVLSAGEHEQLVTLTNAFATIFQKAVAALAADGAALERMGFPWLASELLAQEAARESGPFLVGRFDFLLERDGTWQLVEYNADTPSGMRETVIVEPLIAQHLGQQLTGTGATLAAAARDAFRAALTGGRVLGLVTDAGYTEDLAQTVFLQRLLAGRTRSDVVLGDVDNVWLRGDRLWIVGHQVDALYRYYPFESLLGRETFTDLFTAVSARTVRLLNGLRGLLGQNKGLLAWIWAHRDEAAAFTADERRVIYGHLPATEWIGDAADVTSSDEARRGVVLKQVFGREGEEVYFGDQLSVEDWQRCAAWGTYIVQRRVAAEPLLAAIRTATGPLVQPLWPTVGSFTVNGRWAGYYTRLGGAITTARAKYAGTFIE